MPTVKELLDQHTEEKKELKRLVEKKAKLQKEKKK